MIVMKFGGTSVEDAGSIERVAEIIKARLDLKPVVVVSAMGKTTRKLLQAAEASAAGNSRSTLGIVADLKARHSSEARQLVKSTSGRLVFRLIDRYFDELKKLLEGLAILGEVPPRGLDKILSYGELLSSAILADALRERGIPARLLDSRDIIKTDDRYGSASPIFDITNSKVREEITPVVRDGEVPVIQGFIGSTRSGAATTLGFEGSDYTATIVGAALEAGDVQIWKDVSGLMTADPAIFGGARTVKTCTFSEAAELTYFGAKVLHPKAVHPAAEKNIPVHIYNSRQPEAIGTAIIAQSPRCTNLIKSIAYKRPVTLVHASAESLKGSQHHSIERVLQSLFMPLSSLGVTPLITAISGSSVVLALDSSVLNNKGRSVMEEVSALGNAQTEPARAIVSIVGDGLRDDREAASRIFEATRDIALDLILHGSSPITINLVVAEGVVEDLVTRLHEVFFQEIDPDVFE